jgi:hypothetical protein
MWVTVQLGGSERVIPTCLVSKTRRRHHIIQGCYNQRSYFSLRGRYSHKPQYGNPQKESSNTQTDYQMAKANHQARSVGNPYKEMPPSTCGYFCPQATSVGETGITTVSSSYTYSNPHTNGYLLGLLG